MMGIMMNRRISGAIAALSLIPSAMFAAGFIAPPVSVGENLEIESRVALSQPAPAGGLDVKVISSDPTRVLVSLNAEGKGAESITVRIAEGQRSSPEFLFYGLASSGTVPYKVSATGFDTCAGEVSLTPSGVVIKGPGSAGTGIRSTPRSWAAKIYVFAAQFDAAGELLGTQRVRGGFTAKVKISLANAAVASLNDPELLIEGGEMAAITEFKPAAIGSTEVRVEAPGFAAKGALDRPGGKDSASGRKTLREGKSCAHDGQRVIAILLEFAQDYFAPSSR